jgi:tetratricopeptide (TPR) repeat protein
VTDASDETLGELLGPAGPAATADGQMFFFPGAPEGGRSPEDAVVVGLIDSGVRRDHPQLAGYLRACRDFAGDDPEDHLGHGTAVALQLLYATGHQDPRVAIVSAKVTDAQDRIRPQAVVDAIDWVAAQGARCVNMSLGFRGGPDRHATLCAAIARHPDILFVVAAGNDGPEVAVCPAACGLDNIMVVGATDESGRTAEYSGRGDVEARGDARFMLEWRHHYERGQALARSGRNAEARIAYERSLAASANAESAFQLGVLDLNEEQTAAAITRFEEALALEPALAEAHEMLGAARLLSGDAARAESSLRAALDHYPELEATIGARARAHFNLALTLRQLGRIAEAREELIRTRALDPDYPRLDAALASLPE